MLESSVVGRFLRVGGEPGAYGTVEDNAELTVLLYQIMKTRLA